MTAGLPFVMTHHAAPSGPVGSGPYRWPALEQFCGTTAGISPSTITRLTTEWQQDHETFHNQSFTGKQFVYIWADGVHFRVRLAEEQLCLLVLMGVTIEGTKELIAVHSGVRESTDSWADLLRDLRLRGLNAPEVLVGDGASVFGSRRRRCGRKRCINDGGSTRPGTSLLRY
jgi:Transposase, Mutator family